MTKMAVSYQPSAATSETHEAGDGGPETVDSSVQSVLRSSATAEDGSLAQ